MNPVVARPAPDPLGYDTSDLDACARAMADDALHGRHDDAVEAELAAVRRALRRHPSSTADVPPEPCDALLGDGRDGPATPSP